MEFPRIMYHKDGEKGGRLFSCQAEVDAAGKGWQFTPIWVRDEINPDEWRRADLATETASPVDTEKAISNNDIEEEKPKKGVTRRRRGRKPKKG